MYVTSQSGRQPVSKRDFLPNKTAFITPFCPTEDASSLSSRAAADGHATNSPMRRRSDKAQPTRLNLDQHLLRYTVSTQIASRKF